MKEAHVMNKFLVAIRNHQIIKGMRWFISKQLHTPVVCTVSQKELYNMTIRYSIDNIDSQ